MIKFFLNRIVFLLSLNDSFARVKRELIASRYRSEMMDFMWETFQKVAGINTKKTTAKSDDETEIKKEDKEIQVPLATFDVDGL